MKKIIIDIASLIYNQRNILKELKMTSPPVNFMKEWLREVNVEKVKEEKISTVENKLSEEDLSFSQLEQKTIYLTDITK